MPSLTFAATLLVCAPIHAEGLLNSGRFQTPEAREWLREHLGVVVHGVAVAGIKGKFDEWAGNVDGKLVDVVAGYEFSNPEIGEIFVSNGDSSRGTRYETPTHSGPVTIEGENNGVLILRTLRGNFEGTADDDSGKTRIFSVNQVHFFYFNLRTLKFVNR